MSITLDSLNLKVNNNVKKIKFLDQEIEIKDYLPIKDKCDLIEIALQKAEENGIFNEVKLEQYFNLNIVYLYTDLVFTAEQRFDEDNLYDILESNGIIDFVIKNIPESEYEFLYAKYTDMISSKKAYYLSAAATIRSVIQDLPANAAAARDIIDNIDPKAFKNIQSLVNIADATGMNNTIPFNKD